MNGVHIAAHHTVVAPDIIGHDHIAAFLSELATGVIEHMGCLGGKADDQRRTIRCAVSDIG